MSALLIAKCPDSHPFRDWPLRCSFNYAGSSNRQSAEQGNRKKGAQTTMFLITRETLRRFALNEILLLIALNLEESRLAAENSTRPAIGAAWSS